MEHNKDQPVQGKDMIAGERLKLAREAIGYSQRSLGKAWKDHNERHGKKSLPITHKTIVAWECCGIPRVSSKLKLDNTLELVADYFGADPEWFTETSESWNKEVFQKKIDQAWRNKYRKRKRGPMSVLNATSDSIKAEDLEKCYREFNGYYFAYINWIDETEETIRTSPYKMLMNICGIDMESNVILTKLTTHWFSIQRERMDIKDNWGWHGVMIPLANSLYFIFEAPYYRIGKNGFVFIIVSADETSQQPSFSGILTTALSIQSMKRFPTSTRILFQKIDDKDIREEDELISQLGFSDELPGIDLQIIQNEIDKDLGLFRSFHKSIKFE